MNSNIKNSESNDGNLNSEISKSFSGFGWIFESPRLSVTAGRTLYRNFKLIKFRHCPAGQRDSIYRVRIYAICPVGSRGKIKRYI